MNRIARFSILTMALGLGACSLQEPMRSDEPIQPLPRTAPSPSKPATIRPAPVKPVAPASKPMPRTSASFAPPPGGASHWDPKLGVYVLENRTNTYYRQRTYYRWDGSWTWSTSPDGPWQSTDTRGVPPGLGRMHGN